VVGGLPTIWLCTVPLSAITRDTGRPLPSRGRMRFRTVKSLEELNVTVLP